MKNLFKTCWDHFPKTHALVTGGLTACLAVSFSLAPSKNAEADRGSLNTDAQFEAQASLDEATAITPTDLNVKQAFETALVNSDITPAQAADTNEQEQPSEPEIPWTEVTVKSGDNLSLIFNRAGLSDREVYRFVNSHKEAKNLTRLQPKETLQLQVDDQAKLVTLKYKPNRLETRLFERTEDSFAYTSEIKTPEIKTVFRTATIDSSLFLAGSKAGMEDAMIMETANIFGWDIDFVLDIRQGDSFKVLYEEQYLDGEKFANGNILAAEFINQGKAYRAVRYIHENGDSQYYTPDGESMRKAFLRTPVDFARISSHFNLRRKHPVLNTIRAHKGTDYAAPSGTPIRAVGDGKVTFAGRNGGYGNMVKIQHGQTYQTRYAHLSKFRRGVRNGATVKQGQVIGYVGSTGLATGPHLHYEFYVNGAVRNPVTVKLPKAESIKQKEMIRFAQQTQPVLAQLGYLANAQLALKEDN